MKNDNNKVHHDHSAGIQATILKIKGTVQNLVEMYIKTFRVNFSFDTPGLIEQAGRQKLLEEGIKKINVLTADLLPPLIQSTTNT